MKEHGNGSGSTRVFVVEARSTYSQPQKHCGMILDDKWREVHFPKALIGVQNLCMYADAIQHGFMNYEAAMALAHWFLAEPTDDKTFPFPALCIETRLVEIEYKYEYSTKEIGVGPALNMLETRRATTFQPREPIEVAEGR